MRAREIKLLLTMFKVQYNTVTEIFVHLSKGCVSSTDSAYCLVILALLYIQIQR